MSGRALGRSCLLQLALRAGEYQPVAVISNISLIFDVAYTPMLESILYLRRTPLYLKFTGSRACRWEGSAVARPACWRPDCWLRRLRHWRAAATRRVDWFAGPIFARSRA